MSYETHEAVAKNNNQTNAQRNNDVCNSEIKIHPILLNYNVLDDAMKELLDVCQQYNHKSISTQSQKTNVTNTNFMSQQSQQSNFPNKPQPPYSLKHAKNISNVHDKKLDSSDESIENLQVRQTDLQKQLDELFRSSASLDRKLNNNKKHTRSFNSIDDDDQELIEFQRIENELRVSEINRQLNSIQEELRLKLYKRLPINSSNSKSNFNNPIKTNSQEKSQSPAPSSSSGRSDESTENSTASNPSNSKLDSPRPQRVQNDPTSNQTQINPSSDIESIVDQMFEYETITPTTSKESVDSSKRSASAEIANIYASMSAVSVNDANQNSNNNGLRINSVNSDLERIEEDEEEAQCYYSNSDRFRTVYKEKLSPIIYGGMMKNGTFVSLRDENKDQFRQEDADKKVSSRAENPIANKLALVSNSSSFKSQNRPLTLYLPRPNDKIDLIEHIQSLGHDLDLISTNLKLTSTAAFGYLRKLSTRNTKKWLKRYFYLDREQKTLAYYEDEKATVKNNPKRVINFNQIYDVYVDHKMSGIGERNRSSKKNYVFVLATSFRKYHLGSSVGEAMRAWIDILYTAAHANDYLHQNQELSG